MRFVENSEQVEACPTNGIDGNSEDQKTREGTVAREDIPK